MAKTANDIADQIADLASQLQETTVAEVRTDLAEGIENHFLGRRGVSRTTYEGRSADDCVIDALADFPTLTDKRLQALRDRFENEGVSDDFKAGLLFAIRLVADKGYEY